MAIFAHTNAYVSINGVDLSDHVVSAELSSNRDTVESAAMSDTDYTVKPTFRRHTFSCELQQDYAASEVYATISAAFDADADIAIVYRPDAGTIGATNPEQQFNCVVSEFVQGGPIGDIATSAFTWPVNGAITRATS